MPGIGPGTLSTQSMLYHSFSNWCLIIIMIMIINKWYFAGKKNFPPPSLPRLFDDIINPRTLSWFWEFSTNDALSRGWHLMGQLIAFHFPKPICTRQFMYWSNWQSASVSCSQNSWQDQHASLFGGKYSSFQSRPVDKRLIIEQR